MYSYKKSERLKSKILIDLLFNEGKYISEFPVKVVWLKTNEMHQTNLQAAFGVSKRYFKNATDRNRLKRLMREAFRLNKNQLIRTLQKLDINIALMIIYSDKNLTSFKEIENKIIVILNRLETIVKPE